MTTIRAWVSVHRGREAAGGLAAAALIALASRTGTLDSFAIELTQSIQMPLLVPLIIGCVIGIGLSSDMDPVHGACSLFLPRLLWATTLLAAGTAAAACATINSPAHLAPLTRNVLLFGALATASTVTLGGTAAWTAPLTFGLACIFLGANAYNNHHTATWAFALTDTTTPHQWLLVTTLVAASTSLYAWRGYHGMKLATNWR